MFYRLSKSLSWRPGTDPIEFPTLRWHIAFYAGNSLQERFDMVAVARKKLNHHDDAQIVVLSEASSVERLVRIADEAERGAMVDVSGMTKEAYFQYLMKNF